MTASDSRRPLGMSPGVRDAFDVGGRVSALELVHRMLAVRRRPDLDAIQDMLPEEPDGVIRQEPERWWGEITRQVAADEFVVRRLAILLLCLLDARIAPLALRTGLLHVLAEGHSPIDRFLSTDGHDLLRSRSRVLAAAWTNARPDVELKGYEPATARLLLGNASRPGLIGPWAASVDDRVLVGRGEQSTFVEGLPTTTVTSLAWRGEDLVIGTTAGLVMKYWDGSIALHPDWRPVQDLAVVSGLALVIRDGRLVVAEPDDDPPQHLDDDQGPDLAGLRQVAGWADDHWIIAGTAGLAAYDPREGWGEPDIFEPGHPVTALVAAPDGTIAFEVDGQIFLATVEGNVISHDPDPPRADAVTQFALGAGGLLVTTGGGDEKTLTVWCGAVVVAALRHELAILAVAASPDGGAVGTVDAEGTTRFWSVDENAGDGRVLADYEADVVTGADLLGVDGTVRALADLICARATEPPLSIGLFGAWGSGKSFFLRRLESRVAVLAAEARGSGRAQENLWVWRNIAQVRFNAWNYAAADVWAGLVDHLLRELVRRDFPAPELPHGLQRVKESRLHRVVEARRAARTEAESLEDVRAAHTAASDALDRARADLDDAQNLADAKRSTAVRGVLGEELRDRTRSALTEAGLGGPVDTAVEAQRTVADATTTLRSAWGLLQAPGRRRTGVALAVAPLVGIAAGLLASGLSPGLVGLAGWATTVAGAVGAGTHWLRGATAWVQRRVERLQALEVDIEREKQTLAYAVAEAESVLLSRTVELTKAEREEREASSKADVLERELEGETPGSLLGHYLSGRLDEGDYRARLGLIGVVQEDLATISDAVVRHNDRYRAGTDAANDDAVNRVVLHIDDLDRCPPEVVVRVLEAVALLLSYPLFVVVVAVDARWVHQALTSVYPEQLASGRITPHDYLEKIFQLPVWVDEFDARSSRSMLDALLGPSAPSDAPAAPVPAVWKAEPMDRSVPAFSTGNPGDDPRPSSIPGSAISVPSALDISASERDALLALAPLLARSPRVLKRFLNTYRLIKAEIVDLPQLALARFLLAVATGHPRFGEAVLAQALEADNGFLMERLDAFTVEDIAWLEAKAPHDVKLRSWKIENARPVVRAVRRYLFRTGEKLANPVPPRIGTASVATNSESPDSRGVT